MRVLPNQEETTAMSVRAWEIYNDDIIDRLTDADYDKNVAIDVESGDWEIGDLDSSMRRLQIRRPNASIVNIYHELPHAERFGWVSREPTQ